MRAKRRYFLRILEWQGRVHPDGTGAHGKAANAVGVDTIFHDCQLYEPGVVHPAYSELKTLDADLRSKMHLTHYGDTFGEFDPAADGFAGFAQPWAVYQ